MATRLTLDQKSPGSTPGPAGLSGAIEQWLVRGALNPQMGVQFSLALPYISCKRNIDILSVILYAILTPAQFLLVKIKDGEKWRVYSYICKLIYRIIILGISMIVIRKAG